MGVHDCTSRYKEWHKTEFCSASINKLMSVFHGPVLFLIKNFIITLSK